MVICSICGNEIKGYEQSKTVFIKGANPDTVHAKCVQLLEAREREKRSWL